jgi:hypothetical protein
MKVDHPVLRGIGIACLCGGVALFIGSLLGENPLYAATDGSVPRSGMLASGFLLTTALTAAVLLRLLSGLERRGSDNE